jgi:glycosyltransferase involved in cell wall biosynthesis
MIVRDEEAVIGRCLESISDLVEEIIIVDTGSSDYTKDVASRFTEFIYDFEWVDDFAAARNYAFSKATQSYLFWMDADDLLLPEDRDKFRNLKASLDPNVDIVMMPYHVGFDEGGRITLSYYRERLLKREKNFRWQDPVHEYIQPSGTIMNAEVCVTHRKVKLTNDDRNLAIYRRLVEEGRELSPRALFYYSMELYYHGEYAAAVPVFQQFLDEGQGWVEDNIKACFYLAKCQNYLSKHREVLEALVRSFTYDTPRAEICCDLGYYYKDTGQYHRAIFWFDLATRLKKPEDGWGFILHDYWDFIPRIELCVCHFQLGEMDQALQYHRSTLQLKPYHPAVIQNEAFFQTYREEKE